MAIGNRLFIISLVIIGCFLPKIKFYFQQPHVKMVKFNGQTLSMPYMPDLCNILLQKKGFNSDDTLFPSLIVIILVRLSDSLSILKLL